MSDIVLETAKMLNILPENDQRFAYEFIKKLVLAWDPDYTRITPEEAQELQAAEESGFVDEADIDWNDLSRYA